MYVSSVHICIPSRVTLKLNFLNPKSVTNRAAVLYLVTDTGCEDLGFRVWGLGVEKFRV